MERTATQVPDRRHSRSYFASISVKSTLPASTARPIEFDVDSTSARSSAGSSVNPTA